MPQEYQLIPVSVQALQLLPENVEKAAVWCGGFQVEEVDAVNKTKRFVAINIPTLKGVERASETDYIIRDNFGRFSVLPAAEFESKYQRI